MAEMADLGPETGHVPRQDDGVRAVRVAAGLPIPERPLAVSDKSMTGNSMLQGFHALVTKQFIYYSLSALDLLCGLLNITALSHPVFVGED